MAQAMAEQPVCSTMTLFLMRCLTMVTWYLSRGSFVLLHPTTPAMPRILPLMMLSLRRFHANWNDWHRSWNKMFQSGRSVSSVQTEGDRPDEMAHSGNRAPALEEGREHEVKNSQIVHRISRALNRPLQFAR